MRKQAIYILGVITYLNLFSGETAAHNRPWHHYPSSSYHYYSYNYYPLYRPAPDPYDDYRPYFAGTSMIPYFYGYGYWDLPIRYIRSRNGYDYRGTRYSRNPSLDGRYWGSTSPR